MVEHVTVNHAMGVRFPQFPGSLLKGRPLGCVLVIIEPAKLELGGSNPPTSFPHSLMAEQLFVEQLVGVQFLVWEVSLEISLNFRRAVSNYLNRYQKSLIQVRILYETRFVSLMAKYWFEALVKPVRFRHVASLLVQQKNDGL